VMAWMAGTTRTSNVEIGEEKKGQIVRQGA
jgi:hypothetical protein